MHPLLSERVIARVLRNVIIENGYMFLAITNFKGSHSLLNPRVFGISVPI